MAAAVRCLGPRAEPFVAARGAHLAAAARALLDGPARAREVARLDASPPEGIERVHPSWWERPASSTSAAAREYLERAATAHLVPMAPAIGELSLATLDLLPAEPLATLACALGRRRLAVAFSSTGAGSLAQLCARLGEPTASELVAESRRVRPSHDEVRAAQRSLFKLAVDASGDPRGLLALAGARWLAPALASRGGDLLQRVAQRLPVATGRMLLAQAGVPALAAEWAACESAVAELARA